MSQKVEKHEDRDCTWQGNNGELILLKERKREPEDFDYKGDNGYYIRSKFSKPGDWVYVDGRGW